MQGGLVGGLGGGGRWIGGGGRGSFAFGGGARGGRGVGFVCVRERGGGGTGPEGGVAVVVDPFDCPDEGSFPVFSACAYQFSADYKSSTTTKRGKRGKGEVFLPNFLLHPVLFCFARVIPSGAFRTTTPHSFIAAFACTSPFAGPVLGPLPLHPCPSSSRNTMPRSATSRSARSRVRSIPVRKL